MFLGSEKHPHQKESGQQENSTGVKGGNEHRETTGDRGPRTDGWPLEAALLQIVLMRQLHRCWFLLLFSVKRSTKLLASGEDDHTLALHKVQAGPEEGMSIRASASNCNFQWGGGCQV